MYYIIISLTFILNFLFLIFCTYIYFIMSMNKLLFWDTVTFLYTNLTKQFFINFLIKGKKDPYANTEIKRQIPKYKY